MELEILEKIRDELVEIKKCQALMTKDLEHHISRTEVAENRLDELEKLAVEIRILLPQVRNLLRWWPIVSGAVLVVVIGKPELLTQVLNFLTTK